MESAQKVFEESKRLVNLGRYRDALNCLRRLIKDMSEGYFQSSFVYHRLWLRNKSSKLLIKCLLKIPLTEFWFSQTYLKEEILLFEWKLRYRRRNAHKKFARLKDDGRVILFQLSGPKTVP